MTQLPSATVWLSISASPAKELFSFLAFASLSIPGCFLSQTRQTGVSWRDRLHFSLAEAVQSFPPYRHLLGEVQGRQDSHGSAGTGFPGLSTIPAHEGVPADEGNDSEQPCDTAQLKRATCGDTKV